MFVKGKFPQYTGNNVRSIKTYFYLQYCRKCITMLLYSTTMHFLKLLCQLYKEVIHTEYEEVLLQGSRIASITYLYLNGPHMSS